VLPGWMKLAAAAAAAPEACGAVETISPKPYAAPGAASAIAARCWSMAVIRGPAAGGATACAIAVQNAGVLRALLWGSPGAR